MAWQPCILAETNTFLHVLWCYMYAYCPYDNDITQPLLNVLPCNMTEHLTIDEDYTPKI